MLSEEVFNHVWQGKYHVLELCLQSVNTSAFQKLILKFFA